MITADKLKDWVRGHVMHNEIVRQDIFFVQMEDIEELIYLTIVTRIANVAADFGLQGFIFAFENAHPDKQKLNYYKICSIRDALIEQGFGAVITKDTKLDDPYIYLNVTWF
jgi:hypothetical protein